VDARDLEGVLELIQGWRPQVVLADGSAPGVDGGLLVGRLRAAGSDAALVVSVASDLVEVAVAALRAGADAFLVRPLEPAHVALVLAKAAEKRRLRIDAVRLRERIRGRLALIGASPELQAAFDLLRRVAPTKAAVLLQGPPGSGKEHLAQALHELSPRRDRPFVRVRCAAVSEALIEAELLGHEAGALGEGSPRRIGRIERAHGGTLYLDEVGRLPSAVQVKVLRVLQEGVFERVGGREPIPVDVRVVAGCQGDLADEVRHGDFRDDLYYRLAVVSAQLPHLSARKADIPALVTHFLEQRRRVRGRGPGGVSPGVLSAFFAYEWPGNLRELETVVDEAADRAHGAEVGLEDLPPVLSGARPEEAAGSGLIPGATLFEIEREAILRTLEQVGGSTARAAEVLGVSVRKVQYRLKEYRVGQHGRRRLVADAGL